MADQPQVQADSVLATPKKNPNIALGIKKKEAAKASISSAVDDFFAEKAEKLANKPVWEWRPKMIPSGLYTIESDRGVIPNALSGMFTSIYEANKAIDKYKEKNA